MHRLHQRRVTRKKGDAYHNGYVWEVVYYPDPLDPFYVNVCEIEKYVEAQKLIDHLNTQKNA